MYTLREKPWHLSVKKRHVLAESYMKKFEQTMPEARCELIHFTPYQLLISVMLSAQTTDKMVNSCMGPLYEQGFTPESVLEMGEQGVLQKIRKIGLAPTKSKNVIKTTKILIEKYNGDVPDSREALEALPGVGRKTANVILGEIFGQPTLAVDTHVYRVGKRLALHNQSTPAKAEFELLDFIDESYLPIAHHWLILHGRYTCKAQKPNCQECFIKEFCPSIVENKEVLSRSDLSPEDLY